MVWQHPAALAALALAPLYWAADAYLSRYAPAARHGNADALPDASSSGGAPGLFRRLMRSAAVALIVMALAQPKLPADDRLNVGAGVSICLALDLSRSMRAEDFRPNRLEAAKTTLRRFVKARPDDRIGMVAFSGDAFLQSPLTLDHTALDRLIERTDFNLVDANGTAIGDALIKAAARLKDAPGKSRVIVLVTDGENNVGRVAPESAAEAAAEMDIRIFAVGVGSAEGAPIPLRGGFVRRADGSRIITRVDEMLLRRIADSTGGRYFNAADQRALDSAMREINRLEKAPTAAARLTTYESAAHWFYLAAFLLLAVESALVRTFLRVLPE
ncbi:MAG: VWA domain-containing protein [Candidatus Poribacteria bacterium]|nr:VWA domain-containing protein [Candidatus Poribacteria bacterium]